MAAKVKPSRNVKEILASEEISLLDLFSLFLLRKKFMLATVAVFLFLGILIALTSPLEFEAEAKILSEDSDFVNSSLSGLSGLAGLAGISLPPNTAQGGTLNTHMYPTIIASEPFLMDLMEEKFYFQSKGEEMSLYTYFSKERPGHIFTTSFNFIKGLPSRFFSVFEKKQEWDIPENELLNDSTSLNDSPRIIRISNEQRYVMNQLTSRINIETTGRITSLKVKMPEPYLSAELNTIVLKKVVDYVVAYKTDKQQQNLEFIQERTKEAENKFRASQLRLASFRDANQGIITQTARTKEEQLQAENNLAFSLYNSLSQQLEQTRIQLKKETPIFTEFQPVAIPLSKAEPRIPKILAIYTILGVVVGGMVIFVTVVRDYFS